MTESYVATQIHREEKHCNKPGKDFLNSDQNKRGKPQTALTERCKNGESHIHTHKHAHTHT